MVKNCYIHIPFCNTICSYCDFCKQYYNKKKVKDYLKKLKEEIDNNYNNEPLETIYIGGGTPTSLSLEELTELFEITDSLNTKDNLEFTIEANIDSITKEKLLLMKEHKVNRLSIGIESINKNNLKFLNRKLDINETKEKIELIRSLGFNNINMDLIYALPIESKEDLLKDIDFLTSLNVEHISTYSLIIEDHTVLKINNVENIDDQLDEEMYNLIKKELEQKGYIHYEISNFSKPNYESKHNMCYWHNEEYYGFGLGAASYINNIRKTNTRSLTNYPNKYLEEEKVDESSKIEYEVILNLRLLEGIDLIRFKEKYNKDFNELFDYQELVNNNLLEIVNNHLRIKEEYLYVSNEIIVKLLQTRKEV
ncbi:MAG: radical SAM family heme chaperone HemW [Bacilli bacterium]|nr:radical SAM family heme chaperone HemW [Bacilli bacterium]MBR6137752.1 radical SAM family heme chaperone HemW [Bacilli bacterium]